MTCRIEAHRIDDNRAARGAHGLGLQRGRPSRKHPSLHRAINRIDASLAHPPRDRLEPRQRRARSLVEIQPAPELHHHRANPRIAPVPTGRHDGTRERRIPRDAPARVVESSKEGLGKPLRGVERISADTDVRTPLGRIGALVRQRLAREAVAVDHPALAGPADTLQRVMRGLRGVVDSSGGNLVDRHWIRSLRVEDGEADLTLTLSPRSCEGRELAERSFDVMRRLLPDTDVFVHHA